MQYYEVHTYQRTAVELMIKITTEPVDLFILNQDDRLEILYKNLLKKVVCFHLTHHCLPSSVVSGTMTIEKCDERE